MMQAATINHLLPRAPAAKPKPETDVTIHVRVPRALAERFDDLAARSGVKRGTLAKMALTSWIENPVIR